MELQLPERQAAELSSLAARSGRTPDELVAAAGDRSVHILRFLHTSQDQT
jgi:hypothetical protein